MRFLVFAIWVQVAASMLFIPTASLSKTLPHEELWQINSPPVQSVVVPTQVTPESRGNMIWGHPLENQARNLALKYGISYSKSDLLKKFGERSFFTLIPAERILEQKEELRLQYKKFNTKVIMYAFYYTKKARKQYPYLLSEEFSQAQLSLCQKALIQCNDFIWGVFTGDEHFPKLIRTLPRFKKNPSLWPEIENIDQEVRMKYGFGKYGIPVGPGDTNPFRWSAFYRWLADSMIERQKKLYSMTKEVTPQVKVLSTDPSSHLWPFEFSRQASYVDIFTAQMQPFANASNITDAGCRTKLYVDLTGKQFWPTPHFNLTTLGYTLSPKEVLDFSSVLAVNGASGLHVYTKNHYPKHPYLDTFSFFLGAQERKKAVLTASYFLNNNQVQPNSKPDFAIFYSNESNQASREELRTVHAYAFAGPVSGSWFRFVDETSIKSKDQWLTKYKLIYVPYATYQSGKMVDALKTYVKKGGMLFIGDPLAFSFDLNGEERSSLREELTGCVLAQGMKYQVKSLKTITLTNADFLPIGIQGHKLPIQGPAWNLIPSKRTQTLAKFDDGAPALILHPYGAGKIIYAAYNFFPAYRQPGGKKNRLDYRIINDEGWRKFFSLFHNKLGIKTNLDAWRFRLPPQKAVSDINPGKFCLTNNFVEFENETSIPKNNKLINGVYFYNKSPNLIGDHNFNRLPFNLGKLTDRRKAIRRSSIVKPSEHIVQWSDARNLIINFEFKRGVLFSGLRIIFSGLLPPVQVEVRTNKSSSFETAYNNSSRDVGVDISELSFSLEKPVNCTGVRINFLNDVEPADLKISEVEIWGDADKK